MIDDPVAAMAGAVSAGVAEMADAITAVLTEIDVAGQAVVTALNAALAGARNPAGVAEAASVGPTNWAAYSHEELYQMLREQADVGGVSEIAAEWGRHAEALTGHADTLREQRAALSANWQGKAAERATERIDQLAGLVGAIGARARQVRQAAQDSADALALARNTMPPPPGQPPLTAASGGPDAERPPSGTATDGSDGVVFAVGAVFTGGTSMFDTDFLSGSAKSRAEEVMRGYESSLHGSDALITPPVEAAVGDTDLSGVTTTAGFTLGAAAPGVPGSGGGGVPWSQLTHGGGPDHGGATGRLPLPPAAGTSPLYHAVNHLQASGRGAGGAGGAGFTPFMTPMTRADGDKDHKRQQPNVVRGLFDDDRIPSKPIIGE
jgi:hypothetical protein